MTAVTFFIVLLWHKEENLFKCLLKEVFSLNLRGWCERCPTWVLKRNEMPTIWWPITVQCLRLQAGKQQCRGRRYRANWRQLLSVTGSSHLHPPQSFGTWVPQAVPSDSSPPSFHPFTRRKPIVSQSPLNEGDLSKPISGKLSHSDH